MDTVQNFKAHLKKMNNVGGALSILSFDAHTGAPIGGAAARAERIGYLSEELFKLGTGKEMAGFLDALAGEKLDKETAAMYRICKKSYDNNVKVPAEKVRAFSELRSKSHVVWEQARKDNDYPTFAPYLKQIVELQKEMIEFRGSDMHPYNQLLDDYEDGLTMDDCDKFFTKIRGAIVPLLKTVQSREKDTDLSFRSLPVPIDAQRKISEFIAKKIGYDLNCGMIRESAHPFCGGTDKSDIRITTRYVEDDFLSSFFSILHECGHAIYEQNKDDSIANTILDSGVSMGVHESQSRFYENIIGRSRPFWNYITDELKTYLPSSFSHVTPDMFYRAVNVAAPSLIRVEADELTYSLHIMLRYEMERMLFNENVDVNKLPGLWNEKTEEYLGLTPPNNAKGILQDVHWCEGLMGYFPSYSLGSALSSQLMYCMEKEMKVYELVEKGDFAPITGWLTKNIHRHGQIYTQKEIVKNATGKDLDAQHYVDYLTEKFG
ncbi:MAG: carboxypeptidase M32 [Defluviitaleaceae bacterium]|nr:carboxypeptidase M32 [Defluviitaleaceae bacterium]